MHFTRYLMESVKLQVAIQCIQLHIYYDHELASENYYIP